MSTAPLRFLSAATVDQHLPAGAVKDQAAEVRGLVDATEQAAARVFSLGRDEHDKRAATDDAVLESAALSADEWTDPGHPHRDELARARESAARELQARQALSDLAVNRFAKLIGRELDALTKADRVALAAAGPKIGAALLKLRPALAAADVRAQRISWLEWIAQNRLDGPPPRRLSPESMPRPNETFESLLDRLLVLAAEH